MTLVFKTCGVFVAATVFGLSLIRARRKEEKSREDADGHVCGASQHIFAMDTQLESDGNQDMLRKTIFTDPKTGTYAIHLIFGPNISYPPHIHTSAEWCYLTKGTLIDNYGEKVAPCFFFNEKGSLHYDISAGPTGCEVLVVKDKGINTPLSTSEHCCC